MDELSLGIAMLAAFVCIIVGMTIYVVGFIGFLFVVGGTALLLGLLAGGLHLIHASRF